LLNFYFLFFINDIFVIWDTLQIFSSLGGH
jgi:hypothetical protein